MFRLFVTCFGDNDDVSGKHGTGITGAEGDPPPFLKPRLIEAIGPGLRGGSDKAVSTGAAPLIPEFISDRSFTAERDDANHRQETADEAL